MMNKADLADAIVAQTGIAKKDVEMVIETLLETITMSLKKGQEVRLTGFGTFSSKYRASRMGVNPQNPSERQMIPAVTIPKFKSGKALKDAIKESTPEPVSSQIPNQENRQ